MAGKHGKPLIIPFGTSNPEKATAVAEQRRAEGDANSTNIITIDTSNTPPLRLHHGPYDFRATPGLGTASDTDTRLQLIQDHLHALCDLWTKSQHGFIDSYFGFINSALAENRDALTKTLADYDGLYHYRDWAFSALRPLPRAQIPVEGGTFVATDCAFWTGRELIAIDLTGFQTPTKSRRAELQVLRKSGVTIIEAASADLAKDGARYLESLLPETFGLFWKGEVLPQSPFKPAAIAENVAVGGVRF